MSIYLKEAIQRKSVLRPFFIYRSQHCRWKFRVIVYFDMTLMNWPKNYALLKKLIWITMFVCLTAKSRLVDQVVTLSTSINQLLVYGNNNMLPVNYLNQDIEIDLVQYLLIFWCVKITKILWMKFVLFFSRFNCCIVCMHLNSLEHNILSLYNIIKNIMSHTFKSQAMWLGFM